MEVWNFEVEHERMMQLIDSYHDVAADDGDDPQDDALGDDDRLTPVAEEEDDEEMIGGAGGGGRREEGERRRWRWKEAGAFLIGSPADTAKSIWTSG